ncbi:MAG: hypothetical protein NT027_08490 [Proteobacteria bacterium]|nr:hypothetical protein [Pseudomonadota bacterium]
MNIQYPLVQIVLITVLGSSLLSHTGLSQSACAYPGEPVNWIMKYCAGVEETHDEIVIQDSKGFKQHQKDVFGKNKCAINKKFKEKVCKHILKLEGYKSIDECLRDSKVAPFFAG